MFDNWNWTGYELWTLSWNTHHLIQSNKKLASCLCSFDKQNPIYQLATQLQHRFDDDEYYQNQDSDKQLVEIIYDINDKKYEGKTQKQLKGSNRFKLFYFIF